MTTNKLLITPETLDMGGFLGGDIVHDTRQAENVVAQIARKVGIEVAFHHGLLAVKWAN